MSSAAASLAGVEVLVFDVFGTVADWRENVIRQFTEIGRKYAVGQSLPRLIDDLRKATAIFSESVDWKAFADEWRSGYLVHTYV